MCIWVEYKTLYSTETDINKYFLIKLQSLFFIFVILFTFFFALFYDTLMEIRKIRRKIIWIFQRKRKNFLYKKKKKWIFFFSYERKAFTRVDKSIQVFRFVSLRLDSKVGKVFFFLLLESDGPKIRCLWLKICHFFQIFGVMHDFESICDTEIYRVNFSESIEWFHWYFSR